MANPLTLADQIIIGDDEYANSLSDDVRVNQGDLNGDFTSQARLMAHWSTLHELALDQETRLKYERDCIYAKVDYNTRQDMKAAGMKATEKMVENTVLTSEIYQEVMDEYHDAKLRTGLLKAARDAMIHRRDMLIQLGATSRAEGNADISIRDREQTVRAIIGNKA